MRAELACLLVALASLAACSDKAELSAPVSAVITVSDTAYAFGQQQTDSKDELLLLIKANAVNEPVVVNWSIRGGDESTRKLAQARATEIRAMLESAGIKVSGANVGNEILRPSRESNLSLFQLVAPLTPLSSEPSKGGRSCKKLKARMRVCQADGI